MAGHLILLVDDFDDALDIYATYLRHKGYQVEVATSGLEAVTKAGQLLPALILMDLRMPGLDGTGALKRLRSDPRFDATPIIALTAHALDEQRGQALAAGFDAVIAKPCLPDDLEAAISSFLEKL